MEYLDPDVIGGARPSRRTEIWALGATVYRALAGTGLYGELPDAQPLLAIRKVLGAQATLHRRCVPYASCHGRLPIHRPPKATEDRADAAQRQPLQMSEGFELPQRLGSQLRTAGQVELAQSGALGNGIQSPVAEAVVEVQAQPMQRTHARQHLQGLVVEVEVNQLEILEHWKAFEMA